MATITAAAGGGAWQTNGTWVGGVKPTAADDVLLTATSGNVTIDSGAVCRSLDCLGYTGTLTHTAAVTLTIGDGTAGLGSRALRLVAGMTYTLGSATTSAISFVSTSATQQSVTWGGQTPGNVTFNGAGGSWQVADVWIASATTTTLTQGTLDTNGKTCSWSVFSSNNANTRTITLGASSITVSGLGGAWLVTSTITVTANTSTITVSGSSATFSGGGKTYGTVVFTGSAGPSIADASNTFATLTRTGAANKTSTFGFAGDQTVTGTLTLTGNSVTNRLLVQSSVVGTARTITAATVTATNVDLADITAAGAASWNLSAISGGAGDALGNTGITFTAPVTRYAVVAGNWSATATWSATSGGAGGSSVPLCHDTVVLDASSAAGTYTADMPRMGATVTCTGFTRTLAFSTTANTVYGSITLASGMTVSGTQSLTLGGRGSHTITSAGKTFTQSISFVAPGGTYTLADAFVTNGNVTVTSGTWDTASVAVTASTVVSTGSATRAITLGTSTVSLTSTANANVWNITGAGTSLTLSAASATIVISTTSANLRGFLGSGGVYGTLTYTVAGSTGGLSISNVNTFGTINFSDASNARTLTLPSSLTTTITTAFNVNGTAGKLMSVVSSTAGTAATLSKSGGTVSCDYLSLQDSTATGGAAWFAGANSTNVSGNTGWIFAAPGRSLLYSDRLTRRSALIGR